MVEALNFGAHGFAVLREDTSNNSAVNGGAIFVFLWQVLDIYHFDLADVVTFDLAQIITIIAYRVDLN